MACNGVKPRRHDPRQTYVQATKPPCECFFKLHAFSRKGESHSGAQGATSISDSRSLMKDSRAEPRQRSPICLPLPRHPLVSGSCCEPRNTCASTPCPSCLKARAPSRLRSTLRLEAVCSLSGCASWCSTYLRRHRLLVCPSRSMPTQIAH